MDTTSVLAALVIVVAAAVFIGIKFYNYRKSGGDVNITIDEFIDKYGSAVIKAMKSAVEVMSVNEDQFGTKLEYQEAIVKQTIVEIRENAADLGIDMILLKLFNDEALTAIILGILDKTLNLHAVRSNGSIDDTEGTRIAANTVLDAFQSFH